MFSFSCSGDILLTAPCEKHSHHRWILIFFYLHRSLQIKNNNKKNYCMKVVKNLCILSRNSVLWNNLGVWFSLKLFTYPVAGVLGHQQPRISLASFHGSPAFLRPRIPWLSISAPVRLLQGQVSAPHKSCLAPPCVPLSWNRTEVHSRAQTWSTGACSLTSWLNFGPAPLPSVYDSCLWLVLSVLRLTRLLWGWALALSPSLISTRTLHLPVPHLREGSFASVCPQTNTSYT